VPIAVVTGANSGIGLETARGLARRGYRTVLLCRNEQRAEAAKADIDASVPDADTSIVLCDLGLQSDVRRAAGEIAERFDRLDVLVNNAAITIRRRDVTSEGIDMMLAVNHLGPMLLTELLRPVLEASTPARVVNVASEAHKFVRTVRLDDLQATRGYGLLGFGRYGETKLMNILTTRQQARRHAGRGVTYNCLHPGGVRTNLGAPPPLVGRAVGLLLKSPAEGARTSLAAATDPAYADLSGSYLVKERPADAKLSRVARDDDLAAGLWDASWALLGSA
jgi:NAD(P)-dependent dehydrogenase (short-subunit alcohol dehydrogenase family)